MYRVWSHRAQGNLGEDTRGETRKSPRRFSIIEFATTLVFFKEIAGYGSTSFYAEYTYTRSDERCQLKGFIRSNTKIGLVLEVMVTERRNCRIRFNKFLWRIYVPSEWRKMPTERIYSKQHQNWSGPGTHGHRTLLPWWKWNQDRFSEERRDSLVDGHQQGWWQLA